MACASSSSEAGPLHAVNHCARKPSLGQTELYDDSTVIVFTFPLAAVTVVGLGIIIFLKFSVIISVQKIPYILCLCEPVQRTLSALLEHL